MKQYFQTGLVINLNLEAQASKRNGHRIHFIIKPQEFYGVWALQFLINFAICWDYIASGIFAL